MAGLSLNLQLPPSCLRHHNQVHTLSQRKERTVATMPPFTPRPYRARKRCLEDGHDNSPKKRRAQQSAHTYGSEVIDLTRDSPEPYTLPPISPSAKVKKSPKTPCSSQASRHDVEKRRRKFRSSPPRSYLEKLHRATTQRYSCHDSGMLRGLTNVHVGCL